MKLDRVNFLIGCVLTIITIIVVATVFTMVSNCVVDITRSNDHRVEVKYSSCAKIEDEGLRTLCITK